ncbi:hypothetical protein ACHAXR_010524 [Thalassiosira sp. AJA248-18]
MVKLRSRKIRSPFSGGGMANNNHNDTTRQNHQHHQHQQQGAATSQQQQRRSQRLTSAADQRPRRVPFESLDPSSATPSSTARSAIASPGKRKPESRGITASIRRAKTAMFRMASSPMTSSSSHAGGGDNGEAVVNSNNNCNQLNNASAAVAGGAAIDERMDTTDDGNDASALFAEASYTSPTAITGPGSLDIRRTPSQEENYPPLALLSPNCGTFYAHAAGAAAAASSWQSNNHQNKYESMDDSNAMDVDDTKPRARASTSDMAASSVAATTTTKNVLEWMKDDAPPELLLKLLSFCGSRKMNALSKVNKAWNEVMKDESVWRVLCEDTHKWSDGDNVPQSWAQFYKQNPCVPIDYDTVDAAFDSISSGVRVDTTENNVMHHYREQRQTARILLHPGPYFLRRPLVANVVGNVEVTIEAIGGLTDSEHGMTWRQNYHKSSSSSSTSEEDSLLLPGDYAGTRTARRPSSPTLRQLFGSCGPRSSSSTIGALDRSSSLDNSEDDSDDAAAAADESTNRATFHQSCFQGPGRPTAVLCLESRRENEPVLRVRQGTVNIRGIKFLHYCEGTDIWNGNAAVQVQRAFGRNGRPLRVEPPSVVPTVNMSDCDIISLSGRGLVIIDGAISHIDNCNVHNSAATGVYVGGAGSMATMTRTDVIDNGTGNTRNTRRGIARGHSGVYVEQGLAKIHDCNISGNTLTGISAISTVQARLHIEESDIRANRTDQMELPPAESGRSVNRNNIIMRLGPGRPRSTRLRESVVLSSPRGQRSVPASPQSPLESDDDEL